MGLDSKDLTISETFGKTTYGIGFNEDGFLYNTSMQNGKGIVGQITTFCPSPATVAAAVVIIFIPEAAAAAASKVITQWATQ
jgi:hypothetical protein